MAQSPYDDFTAKKPPKKSAEKYGKFPWNFHSVRFCLVNISGIFFLFIRGVVNFSRSEDKSVQAAE
jgi:hypothetical protein